MIKEVLNRIIPQIYMNEGQSGMRYGYPTDIGIRVKIEQVYDSTQ